MLVCIVDDEIENAKFIQRALDTTFDTVAFVDPREALEYTKSNAVDIIVADQKMPELTGLQLIQEARFHSEDNIAIIVSAYTDRDDLIEAVNSNRVFRYLVKPFGIQTLRDTVSEAANQLRARRRNRRLQEELSVQNQILLEENQTLRAGVQPVFDVFTGSDPGMKRIKELAVTYALSTEPVLITGETGTGKELLARVVHHLSPRRDRPFVAVNCSTLGADLFESTLFGHKRGAFTGADRDKAGLVEEAEGGTVFLDEVGDLPPGLQPKLLRFLQFGAFFPVGATEERTVDVRVISATNQNIRKMVQDGQFRQDLLYRLDVFQIHLPPLRQRRQDIVPIMKRIAAARGIVLPPFSDQATAALESNPFPGNVRELQNFVNRLAMVVLRRNITIVDRELIDTVLRGRDMTSLPGEPLSVPKPGELVDLRERVAQLEQTLIAGVLQQEQGNITRASQRLGLSRQGLRNKLKLYGLESDG